MSRRRRWLPAVVLPIALILAACGGAAPAAGGDPVAAVRSLFDRVSAGDIDGSANLACAAQRDAMIAQLSGLGGQLPGVDPRALFAAFDFDTSGLTLTEVSRSGTEAQVKVEGTVRLSVDGQAFLEVLGPLASSLPFTPEQLEQQIDAQFANGIPVDRTTKLVQEGGAWKVCDPQFSIAG